MKFAAAVLAGSLGTVNAWWDKGHLIAARIAYDHLESESPAALQGANELLAILKNEGDILALDHENDYPFVECAPFADTIKGQGYSYQSDWHFTNQPYLDEDPNIEDYDFPAQDPQDVTQAITDINNWMLDQGDYKSSYTYTKTMSYFDDADQGKSFAFRLLIHYLGDSHQPCHSITRVDDEFPSGDRGCNSLYLQSYDGASNLHAVWDSVIYEEPGKQSLPMNEYTWADYGDIAADFASKYPVSKSDYHDADPAYWAQENMETADIVYGGVTENSSLSSDYQAQAVTLAEERIAYAGRRLANMVKTYFPQSQLFLQ